MCGIAGEIAEGVPANLAAIEAMTDSMASRGPDSSGVWAREGVALGHRRLSIIDLSCSGHQPMHDPELGLTVAFNGCIYNYPELRQQLLAKGYRFFSHSDTEVILKGYREWGERVVDHLKGMFAFAVDRARHRPRDPRPRPARRQAAVLVRGRPRSRHRRLRFASSLPALVAAGGVDTEIDPVALHHYLSFHSVVPAPHTILRGVRKLPPGTIMRIEPDGRRTPGDVLGAGVRAVRGAGRLVGARMGGGDPRLASHRRGTPPGRRRARRLPALRRPGLQPDRRAARRGGSARPGDVLHRLRSRGRRGGRRVQVLRRHRQALRHRPPPDPHRHRAHAAVTLGCHRGHERADDEP